MQSLLFYHTHKHTKFGMACRYRLRQHKGRMKLGIACPRSPWIAVSKMTAGVTCNHDLWSGHTVGQVGCVMFFYPLNFTHRRTMFAWYAIIAIGNHTRSNDIERGIPSRTFESTHGLRTLGVACHHIPWTAHTI